MIPASEEEKKAVRAQLKGKLVHFDKTKPEQVFSRDVVRQFLYEYLTKRSRVSRVPYLEFESRHYFVGKCVKDFIVMSGKTEFTFAEIAEIIEANAMLNYCSDTLQQMYSTVWRYRHE